jgi:hypothetical protein
VNLLNIHFHLCAVSTNEAWVMPWQFTITITLFSVRSYKTIPFLAIVRSNVGWVLRHSNSAAFAQLTTNAFAASAALAAS